MKTTAFSIVLLFVASFLPTTAADRIALVIGNSDYSHVPTLANPENDAREVSALFRTAGYDVTEVLDGTVKEMGVALRTFALAGRKAATAVFYFAGHGFEVAGKNYLAPVDAELAVDESLSDDALDAALGFALDDETLPLESVLGELRNEVPGLKIVVLDCCRDNPFARTRSWARSRSGVGGLAQVTEAQLPEGTMLVFSGEPGQQVPDGTGDHSPFAEALLGEMRNSAGLPVLTVFTGVATKVTGRQKPWIKFDGTGQSLHAFSTVALMSREVPVAVKAEDSVTSAEMAKLRDELASALQKLAAADGNVAEMAKLQKELGEARTKMAAATPAPMGSSNSDSLSSTPASVPIVKAFPAPGPNDSSLGMTHDLINAFLLAPDAATRIKYTYQGERLRTAIEDYHKEVPIRPLVRHSLQLFQMELDTSLGGPYWLFIVSSSNDEEGFPLIVRTEEGMLKIDWEIYSEFFDRNFVRFREGAMPPPATFRLIIERFSDYNGSDRDAFTNRDDYLVFQVNPPYGALNEFSEFTFVKKDSPLAKKLNELVPLGSGPLAVVLTLDQQTFEHGVKHSVISEVVTEGWFR